MPLAFLNYTLRGAHYFFVSGQKKRFGPYRAVSARTSFEPYAPFRRRDLDHVRQVLAAGLRPLGNLDVKQTPRFMQGGLHRRSTDACERRNLVVRQIANPVVLHLANEDAEHRTLAFGVMVAKIGGHHA